MCPSISVHLLSLVPSTGAGSHHWGEVSPLLWVCAPCTAHPGPYVKSQVQEESEPCTAGEKKSTKTLMDFNCPLLIMVYFYFLSDFLFTSAAKESLESFPSFWS